LRKGESPILPGEEREEEAEDTVGAGGVSRQRACFSFSGAFKTYATPWEGRLKRFPPNNERVGRGTGGSQPGEGGLVHPQATFMSPKLFLLLACLNCSDLSLCMSTL
jgi:hypothetical protein